MGWSLFRLQLNFYFSGVVDALFFFDSMDDFLAARQYLSQTSRSFSVRRRTRVRKLRDL
jgi:hypothetical protein